MIGVYCDICMAYYVVGGQREEIEQLLNLPEWKESFPCITPLCGGRLIRAKGLAGRPVTHYQGGEIPVRNFYRAALGFGTGLGAPASLERLRKILLEQNIVQVVAEPVGQPERVILKCLVMDNGTRLHLDASSRGACVYYIEEPGKSCLEVVEDEIRAGAAAEGSPENREEAGRAPEAVGDVGRSGQSAGVTSNDGDTHERAPSGVSGLQPQGDVHAGATTTADGSASGDSQV